MMRLLIACGVVGCCFAAVPSQAQAQVTYAPNWSYNPRGEYYYKACSFPHGGHQYLIFYTQKPTWVYWYNPDKRAFWCACPTVLHPKWGQDVRDGKDLFLPALQKEPKIHDTVFPDAGKDGANFKKLTAKDQDGSEVQLACPPIDLPVG